MTLRGGVSINYPATGRVPCPGHKCPKCGAEWSCTGTHVYSLGWHEIRDNYRREMVCTPCLSRIANGGNL